MKQYVTRIRSRRTVMGLAFLLVLGIGAWLAMSTKGNGQENAPLKFVPVETGAIEETVTAQGKLEPKEYVDVGMQVSGQLKKIHVEIGDDVQAGDLLVEIDRRIYLARVEASTAQLANLQAQRSEQQANLDLAKLRAQRNQQLIESKAISKDALDESLATVKAAEARIKSLASQIQEVQSTLNGDKTNLEYTNIMAPMTGTVVQLNAREGQTFNASQTAPTILQLANLDTMTVRAQVAEADVMRINPGMQVYFTTLGMLDRKWQGIVRQVLPSPQIVNDVVLYDVLIDVDNRERKLMNGMSTQVFFIIGKAENVALIPMEALGKRVEGETYVVRVKDGRNTAEKQVRIGLRNRTSAEILDGLKPGDMVAIAERGKPGDDRGGGFRFGPGL